MHEPIGMQKGIIPSWVHVLRHLLIKNARVGHSIIKTEMSTSYLLNILTNKYCNVY